MRINKPNLNFNKIAFLLMFLLLNSAKAFANGLDSKIDALFAPISDFVSDIFLAQISICGQQMPILILLLIVASIIFSIYLSFINIWGFKNAVKQVIAQSPNTDSCGEVSSIQALSTALSGTLGLGSIAGVAIAISLGGPGAMFWMFCGAFFGMASKFFECTLAVKYRRFNADGSVSGGPMYYIAHGLTRKGMRPLGQALAFFFALMCIPGSLGGGNMLQVNQATQQVIYITGGENSFFYSNAWICGLIIAAITAYITFGGIKSIAGVASKIVPFMCGLYIVSAAFVIIANIQSVPYVFYTIIKEAFVPQSVTGGVIGSLIIGFRRSIQSNEAGAGSAPIAYAATKTKEPVAQGFVSLLEPFFTVSMCFITAFVIIITGKHLAYTQGITGIELTSSAFATLSPILPPVLSVVIIFFAFSTVISWSYYGLKAWTYLVGEGKKRETFFLAMFCLVTVVGSCMNLQSVVDFTDATMLAMAAPNLIAIFILMPEIKKDLKEYCANYKISNWLK